MILKKRPTLSVVMLILFTTLSVIGCGSDTSPQIKNRLHEDNAFILGVPTPASQNFGLIDYKLQLKKEAFQQTFLLNTSVISGPPSPAGSAFANKLVYFKKRGGFVGLFEKLDGKLTVARTSMETEVLLANFPILNQYEDGSTLIDFNKGMNLFYEKDGMVASDYSEGSESVSKVQFSYVRDAYIKGYYFYISQVARVKNKPQEIRYALSTYVKNKNFSPKKSNLNKSVGYFEIPKVIKEGSGEETYYITRFDTSKKITFYLTRNIPADFRQAVADGVLYWNRSFGSDIVEVKTLPTGISIHEPGYNVVQWLDWDDAGFAYANLHADPLTGETLQAFVYMTSVFAKGGLNRAKRLLKKFGTNPSQLTAKNENKLFIQGFKPSAMTCAKDQKWAMRSAMLELAKVVNLLDSDETLDDAEKEALYLRFSQDYVREVVAHEIGHTLGLRHNFAGSLENTLTPKFYDRLVKMYFFTGELPNGQIPNATVMDYTPGVLAAMAGAHIRNNRAALPYDAKAIEWGYTAKTVDELNIPTFCTDSKASGAYADCLRFDHFSNVITGSYKEWQMELNNHAFALASKFNFLNSKKYLKKNPSQAKMLRDVLNVSLRPQASANGFFGSKEKLLKLMTEKSQLLKIRKNYPENLTMIDEDDYKQEMFTFKQSEIEKLGGFTKVFLGELEFSESLTEDNPYYLAIINKFSREFKAILEDSFQNIDPTIVAKIENRMDKYFTLLEKEYLLKEITDLRKMKPILKDENFPKALKQMVVGLLFKQKTEILGTYGTIDQVASVHDYYFNYTKKVGSKTVDLRKNLVALLGNDFYPEYPSYLRTLKPLKTEVKEMHKKVVEAITSVTKEEDLAPEVYDWLAQEKKRFSSLK